MSDQAADPGRAEERTQLAWQRTGLSYMALGAISLRLLPSTPARPVLAVLTIITGALVSAGSRRMHPTQPHRLSIAFVAATTAAIGLVSAALSLS